MLNKCDCFSLLRQLLAEREATRYVHKINPTNQVPELNTYSRILTRNGHIHC